MMNWGVTRWGNELLCVTRCRDIESLTGKTYALKSTAIHEAKRHQTRYAYAGIVAENTKTRRVQWVRRSLVEYDLEGNYGAGYELLTSETEYKQIIERLREYQRNDKPGGLYKIKKRRVMCAEVV